MTIDISSHLIKTPGAFRRDAENISYMKANRLESTNPNTKLTKIFQKPFPFP